MPKPHEVFLRQFKAAILSGTPLVSIQTADQAAAVGYLHRNINWEDYALLQWDAIRGITPLNTMGESVLDELVRAAAGDSGITPSGADLTRNAAQMVGYLPLLPNNVILFWHNAQRVVTDDKNDFATAVVQGICNTRDLFKSRSSMVVFLTPQLVFPMELRSDVIVLDEPLPSEADLRELIKELWNSSQEVELESAVLEQAVEALLGLSAFQAEQATAMALVPENGGPVKLDTDSLWEIKRRMVSETPGLSIHRGNETFDVIGGNEGIRDFARREMNGEDEPGCYVLLDEFEKATAGANSEVGDNTGVSQDQVAVLLTEMQNKGATGILALGHPGCGKSVVAKAWAGEAKKPLILLDLGAMKSGPVGTSEQNIRRAIQVIWTVGGGKAFFIATCNSFKSLKPEMRRRFSRGMFMFDLPNEQEKAAIWKIHLKANKLPETADLPPTPDWTGAEIKQCCDLARAFRITPVEAATYIVPMAKSAREVIQNLRNLADGAFLSAAKPGPYRKPSESAVVQEPTRRTLSRTGGR